MKPIRVLHLMSGFVIEEILGGVTRYVVELLHCLPEEGISPAVGGLWSYGTAYEAPRQAELIRRGIPAVVAARWDEERAYQSCVRAWRDFPAAAVGPVEIIHSHGEFSDLLALLLRRKLGAKLLVRTIHNEIEWAKRPVYGKVFPNLLYPFCFAAELGVSRRVVENANQRPLSRLLGHRAQVMHNALNFARFEGLQVDRRAKLEEFGIPADAPVVGTVGRLAPQKAVDLLIAAAPRVLARFPQAHFLVVGDGPLRAALEEQAQALQLGGVVHFAGPRGDVEELLGVMGLFVSSSRWEGLPTVILESMAARTPVVATRVSGTVELVEDERTGLLVAPGDGAALAAAINRMLEDRPLARRLAAQAEAHVRAHFSMAGVARRHAALYRSLLAEK